MSHQSSFSLLHLTLRCARVPFLLALSGTLVAGVLALFQMVTLAEILVFITHGQIPPSALLVFALVLCVRVGVSALADWQAARTSAAVRNDLRHNLYRALMERGPVHLSTTTSGALANILIERVEACDAYIARYAPALLGVLVLPLLTLLLITYYKPLAILAPLAALLLMPILLALLGQLAKRASERQFLALTRMGSLFADRLRNLTLLRSLDAAEREQQKLAQNADDFRTRTLAVLRVAFLSAGVLDVLLAATLIGQVFLLLHTNTSLPVSLVVLLLTLEFFAPLRALSATYHDRASATAALTEITPLLESIQLPATGRRFLPEPLKHPSMDIMKVTYTHPGRSQPALNAFSLRVEGSEFVAITGPSGAGKSTLLHLLLGFIEPHSGALAVAQQPLNQIDPSQRARLFSYVGQRAQLFAGTLDENIRLGRPQATESEVLSAIHAAGLTDVVTSLPAGLATRLGERGYGLSGGQAQRVALARAFLRDAPILLLDEPTAGLDSETAHELLLAIKKLAKDRTVLMVSHDAAALAMAERIVRVGEVKHA